MNPLYDTIGTSYSQTRKADTRISNILQQLLGLPSGSRILDVGAGTGNYSLALAEYGFHVWSLEPSTCMRAQAMRHERVTSIAGASEKIPLENNSVDGAIIVLAFHHFPDQKKSIEEICRVVGKGPIVIFSWDAAQVSQFWLAEYFPTIYPGPKDVAGDVITAQKNILTWTGRKSKITPFLLPHDLVDHFLGANWARPEAYLNPAILNGISCFAALPVEQYQSGIQTLEKDLSSGRWDEKYGALRSQKEYDVGYRFLTIY